MFPINLNIFQSNSLMKKNLRKVRFVCMKKKSPFFALFYSSKQIIQLTGNTSTQDSSFLIKWFSVESLMRCCNLCLDSLHFIPVYTITLDQTNFKISFITELSYHVKNLKENDCI